MAEEISPEDQTTSEPKEQTWTERRNKMIVDELRANGFDGIIEIQWG